jgi:acetylornithine deacetylase/succinyl-diaminopimelate desuccinylase-like protein
MSLTTPSLETVLSKIDEDMPQATERLINLLRIPSISTDPAYKNDCDDAADWLVADLRTLGATVSKRPTPGHPMVLGHVDGPAGKDTPHLLFYGHYDVQPVDPLDLWDSPPFEPQVEDTGNGPVIRGRGSSDDKGQLMTFVEACRAWKAVHGELPCKITFFFEGEEESGSPSLVPFMEQNAAELTSDVALICDTGLFESKVPAIVTMLRGLMAEEIVITGPDRDLHSGMYGGIAMNPIRVISKIITGLHDATGRITLPGFYDGVEELDDAIRSQWQSLAFDHAKFLGDVGLSQPAGEQDRTPLEMIWSRPTCDVNGIWGGYQGAGFKTVLPSQAGAKISFRLVGQQDPVAIHAAFENYVNACLPEDYTAEFPMGKGSKASQMSVDNPAFEQARTALSDEWPDPAAYVGCGGSIPIAGHFQDILGVDPMLIGFGHDDDQIHSPNEKYSMESFQKGTRSWARILDALTA